MQVIRTYIALLFFKAERLKNEHANTIPLRELSFIIYLQLFLYELY